MEDNYVMVLEHVNQSDDFAFGFEAGIIWQKMKAGESFKDYPINEANFEQVMRMCDAMGYDKHDAFQNVDGYVLLWAWPVDISSING